MKYYPWYSTIITIDKSFGTLDSLQLADIHVEWNESEDIRKNADAYSQLLPSQWI